MIGDDLINRIDSIEDLPVSEEMLGAYMEGNLTDAESLFVRSQIEADLCLTNLEFAVRSYDEDMVYEENETSELDDIFSIELPTIDFDTLPGEEVCIHSDMEQSDLIDETDYSLYQLPEIDISHDSIDGHDVSELDNNP